MTRRQFVQSLFATMFGVALLPCLTEKAKAADLDPEEIKAILRTATPEDDGFIERAVQMVSQGTLPRAVFESSYIWARKKPKHKFQYFRRALILRAAAEGIKVE